MAGSVLQQCPPCSKFSQSSSLSALQQWGHTVKMRSCYPLILLMACAPLLKPWLQVSVVAPGAEPVPEEHLPTECLLQLLLHCHGCASQKQKTPGNICGTSFVCDCPHQFPLSIKYWRLKGCSCGSAEAREKCRLLCDD